MLAGMRTHLRNEMSKSKAFGKGVKEACYINKKACFTSTKALGERNEEDTTCTKSNHQE
jgi:hypothetical protein